MTDGSRAREPLSVWGQALFATYPSPSKGRVSSPEPRGAGGTAASQQVDHWPAQFSVPGSWSVFTHTGISSDHGCPKLEWIPMGNNEPGMDILPSEGFHTPSACFQGADTALNTVELKCETQTLNFLFLVCFTLTGSLPLRQLLKPGRGRK